MTTSTIFLVDESVDVEILKTKIKEFDIVKVISFDYYSHKSLELAHISHEKVENYLDMNDCKNIDEKVMQFSTNWYKHEKLKKYIEYKDVNLGSLFELEFPAYFFKILKKFIGILRILEKEQPEFIASSPLLLSMVKILSNDVKLLHLENMDKTTPSLVFDKIHIRFNLGKKHISFYIKRQTFFKIKILVEKLSKFLFNLKNTSDSLLNDSVLLLEFNPVTYQDLLLELSKFNKKVVLFNQRKPAVNNLKSLKIVKKCNCRILFMDDLSNDPLTKKINSETLILNNKLKDMFASDVFNEIFLIDGYSIWNSMKSSFTNICYNRFSEALYKIQITDQLFKRIKFKCILEWAHNSFEEKIVIHESLKHNIPVITLQHGLMTLNPVFDKYQSIMPYLPSKGTKMAVWGEIMKNYNISHGIKEDQLLISGSPRHDVFFREKKNKKSNGIILIVGSSFFEINCSGNDTDSYVKFEEIIRTTCRTALQIPGKHVVAKMHPAPIYFDIKDIIDSTDSNIVIYQDKSLLELLMASDVMIALTYSTTLLDAMIIGIPTITIVVENQQYEQEPPIKNNATLCVKNQEELKKAIHDVLYDDQLRDELIKNGHKFVNDCLSHPGQSSKYIAKIISNL